MSLKTSMDYDALGNRMKAYESRTISKVNPGEHFIVRLDGRAFHTFTKGLEKPYDIGMTLCMQHTMMHLVKEFNFDVGYTQSDEITLVKRGGDIEQEVVFDGRVDKLLTVIASTATAYFNFFAGKAWLTTHMQAVKSLPVFDGRLFTAPTVSELVNNLIWRQQDAVKNAISMAAHAHFSNSEVHGKSGAEKQEMLFSQKGINFNDYPPFFKRGIFARREKVVEPLSDGIKAKIPEGKPIPETVTRTKVMAFDLWITKVGNQDERIKALFE